MFVKVEKDLYYKIENQISGGRKYVLKYTGTKPHIVKKIAYDGKYLHEVILLFKKKFVK